jgi:hypothetical protein
MIKPNKIGMKEKLGNIKLKLSEATGPAVGVELRMRITGELSDEVRKKIIEIRDKEEISTEEIECTKCKHIIKRNKKKSSAKYLDCNLEYLEQAILEVFKNRLTQSQVESLETARKIRNKLLHGDFVKLMNQLNIEPLGREIMKDGYKALKATEMSEAIISVDKNGGLERCRSYSNEASEILDNIIRWT